MYVESKFLTGDVKIQSLEAAGESLKITGSLKEMFPVVVEIRSEDIADLLKASLDVTLAWNIVTMITRNALGLKPAPVQNENVQADHEK